MHLFDQNLESVPRIVKQYKTVSVGYCVKGDTV